MTQQESMIGEHPQEGLFFEWTECRDTECTPLKRHRELIERGEKHRDAIEKVASWLVTYHLPNGKRELLIRKKKILEKYDFADYAKSLHVFPNTDKTKKGNIGEVILTEYLSKSSGISVLIYKLHYNPNVDQSMKGDDVLLTDTKRIIVGESKFRSIANKKAVDDAAKTMDTSLALPLSLGFVADRLFDQGLVELAEKIQEMQLSLGKTSLDIKNVAFLLSRPNVGECVEQNMSSLNNNFIFLSLGIENPVDFVEEAFRRASELLLEVSKNESEYDG